jgi:spore coat protein CotH
LATVKVTIDAAAMGGGSTSAWLDYFWSKWNHCSPHNFIKSQFAYESPDSKGNVTCQNVGMRLRGSQPRGTNQIQGFKLDMQVLDTAATTHRRFADQNRINILSVESDPSHMIQCLSYKVLRDFGLPAPLCNHLKVYVNGAYYGLLENVEQINRGFVRRHFGTNTGSLYAASPSMGDCTTNAFKDSEARLAYSGDSFSTYKTQYLLDGTTTAADAEKNLIPMLKCGDATQTANDADFKKCIADWIDVNEWLKQIAAESLMPTLQSWVGYYRNYYLYFNPDASAPHGGKFAIWSWDLDSAFQRNKCYPSSCDPLTSVDSLFGPRNTRAKLVQRLTTVFRTEYCKALNDFASTALASSKVDAMAKVIEPAMSNEPSVTSTEWQAEVSTIREYFTQHATAIKSLVSTACP